MTDDIISHFEVLDCSNHRARHPFTRAFIVERICVILFDIIKYNTVDVGSIFKQTVCFQIEYYRTYPTRRFYQRIWLFQLLLWQVGQVYLKIYTKDVHSYHSQKSVAGLKTGGSVASCSVNLQRFRLQSSFPHVPVSPE